MLKSSNDVTGGQKFSLRVTEKITPDGSKVFEASTKNAPELGSIQHPVQQMAVRLFNDRLGRFVAEGYDAKKALARERGGAAK